MKQKKNPLELAVYDKMYEFGSPGSRSSQMRMKRDLERRGLERELVQGPRVDGSNKAAEGLPTVTCNWINRSENSTGTRIGVVDIVTHELNGHQYALFCYAGEGSFLQVGLLTVRGCGPWYTRVTPLVGYHKER